MIATAGAFHLAKMPSKISLRTNWVLYSASRAESDNETPQVQSSVERRQVLKGGVMGLTMFSVLPPISNAESKVQYCNQRVTFLVSFCVAKLSIL